VKESSLGNPPPSLDQFLLHHGNLSGRLAEIDDTKLQPEANGFSRLRKNCCARWKLTGPRVWINGRIPGRRLKKSVQQGRSE